MNIISSFFIVGLLTLVWSTAPSLAQKRIALVIGNSNYTQLQSLPNPGNDSRLMAKTLSKLGFEVITAVDANRITLSRAVRKFGKALRKSGKDTVGLFYYAGHGVQARGQNYLIPLEAEVEDEADLDIEAISASNVLTQMEAAGNTLNLVILDACRNNPFKGKMRSSSRGLARLNAASGSLVAFAAAPGQVAADGIETNSPYTKALVKAMQVPGLSVEQMFKRVRISVEAQTNNQQTPWEESSLRGNFYFTPQKVEPAIVATPKVDQAEKEWATIQNTQSTSVLKAFINRHPDSVYASYARLTLGDKMIAAERQETVRTEAARIATEKAREQKTARLNPGVAATFTAPAPTDPYQMTVLLQSELTRVGCSPGTIDGQWGAKGRRALARFKRFARLALPYKDISLEVVDAVKQQRSRVCPKTVPVKVRKTKVAKKSRARNNLNKASTTYFLNNENGIKYKNYSDCIMSPQTSQGLGSEQNCQ